MYCPSRNSQRYNCTLPCARQLPRSKLLTGPDLESFEVVETDETLTCEVHPHAGDLQQLVTAGIPIAASLGEREGRNPLTPTGTWSLIGIEVGAQPNPHPLVIPTRLMNAVSILEVASCSARQNPTRFTRRVDPVTGLRANARRRILFVRGAWLADVRRKPVNPLRRRHPPGCVGTNHPVVSAGELGVDDQAADVIARPEAVLAADPR